MLKKSEGTKWYFSKKLLINIIILQRKNKFFWGGYLFYKWLRHVNGKEKKLLVFT